MIESVTLAESRDNWKARFECLSALGLGLRVV